MVTSAEELNSVLTHNIAQIYPSREELMNTLQSGKQLYFYIGIDPNIPDVHLGHALVYRKLEELRQLGHKVIFLLGDFTAQIGDPTDKSATRVRLTHEQVKENSAKYKEQVGKVLDFESPDNPAEMKFNSEWLAKLTFEELIELSANFTVQQMIERDMFQNRLKENKPIYLHEFFYPLMQGYDSVAMDVDGELGGTDQTFNMLAGRELVKTLNGKEKYVITCNFLMGLDGKKMSKSTGNYISLQDQPFEMYRKVMTLNDEMIPHYFDMIFDERSTEIDTRTQQEPLAIKKELATRIVTWLYDDKLANDAAHEFTDVIQKNEIPSDIQTVVLTTSTQLVDFIIEYAGVTSKSEARRLIEQGGVSLDDAKIDDINYTLEQVEVERILKVGKAVYIKITN